MGNHDFHPPFVRLHHALSMPDGTDEICGASLQFEDAPAEAQLHPVGGARLLPFKFKQGLPFRTRGGSCKCSV